MSVNSVLLALTSVQPYMVPATVIGLVSLHSSVLFSFIFLEQLKLLTA